MLGYRWRVYEPFRFYFSEDKNDEIEVPVGLITRSSHFFAYFLVACHRMENTLRQQLFTIISTTMRYARRKKPI